jgi:general nucleoside transport system permease protein
MSPFDVGWLASAIALAAPLLIAALGELVLERSGVLNIGIEGLLVTGAFTGFAVAWASGSVPLGVVAAMAAAILLALLMAGGVLALGADQIVIGFGILIFALGGTAFLNDVIFSGQGRVSVPAAELIEIPVLSSIPVLGPALFRQTVFVYLAYLLVPLVALLLARTQLGLMLRATGESPAAVRASGHSPERLRTFAFVFAGGMAGLAGAVLSVGAVGVFNEGMTGGRGFLALAAVAFAAWRTWWLLGACLFFGGVDALQLRLQALGYVPATVWAVLALLMVLLLVVRVRNLLRRRSLGLAGPVRLPWLTAALALGAVVLWVTAPEISIPPQFYLMLPYIAAIAVLAGLAGRSRAPAALAEPLPARV